MKDKGFYQRICQHADLIISRKGPENIDFNIVNNEIYEYVCKNIPPDIQQSFYFDVRKFVDEYVFTEKGR
jgi:hypothetical protein